MERERNKYSNGTIYKGEFKKGKMNGKGTFQDANGALYKGDFKNDLMHGNGMINNNLSPIYNTSVTSISCAFF
jgi:hypothetical protein